MTYADTGAAPKFPCAVPPRKIPHKDLVICAEFCRFCGATGMGIMIYGDRGCVAVKTIDMPEIRGR